ncbi:hypothetical protein Fleli_1004 [Bernardetia litoralis DSM 6794]|uniref:Uncharacterized protein n=1 Tax=Bernardetia litoralis (strain ATCC 23117 / DSM 6794 / NBRC 15988 / NCIMB 1366 / Fx l1 / Sio-4) TaxID=880071 RepID=I4AHL6_BERLS|nr:hypothetical protein Fleli_1004 [Bernardetia litoralis DSM 6794]
MILILTFVSAKAHNPNTASIVVSPINGFWIMQFAFSQESANAALTQFYPTQNLKDISVEEYKKLYIDYVKNKTSLKVDGQKIELSSGEIKLGNHQTDMKFLLPTFPKDYKEVQIKLSVFEENEEQNTALKFVENDKSIRKVINHQNEFSFSFQNKDNKFIEVVQEVETKNPYFLYIYIGFGVLLFVGLIFLVRR